MNILEFMEVFPTEESDEGLSIELMQEYIPLDFLVFNPQEFDPLGGIDDDPNYNTVMQEYNIVDGCPKSNFSYTSYSQGLGLKVDFFDNTNFQSSHYPDSSFVKYWNFGDGTGSFQKNPSHKYSTNGSYKVTLTTFSTDCGCWHVHTSEVKFEETYIQLKDGNPDCPFEEIIVTSGWSNDPMGVYVRAEPNIDAAVPPNTGVANYIFEFYTLAGTLVYSEERGVLDFIFYKFEYPGVYNVVVKAEWNGGCISESSEYKFSVYEDIPPAEQCCVKRDRVRKKYFNEDYDDNQYRFKINDIARGTWGEASWRKIQGTQELFVKKPGNWFWKKQPAWHYMEVEGFYYDRTNAGGCTTGYLFEQNAKNCYYESPSWDSYSPGFPNRFGLDKESISISHEVYLGGNVELIPPTLGNCCDCNLPTGHLLFNEIIKLGECD